MTRTNQQNGFVLLPVVLAIVLTAVIAFMLNNQSVLDVGTGAGEAEIKQAEYVTKAGLEHAVWGVQNSSCGGDMSMTSVPFGQSGADSYSATATTGGSSTTYSLFADQDAWIDSGSSDSNNGSDAVLKVMGKADDLEQPLVRFDLSSLPSGAQINSAIVSFYVDKEHPEGPVTVHRIGSDWVEDTVTWDILGANIDKQVLAMIPPQPQVGVWVQVNITAQVQAWMNGDPNNGIALISNTEELDGQYVSREGSSNQQPRLDVVVGAGSATPAAIQATGTLANGVTRTLSRPATVAYQAPGNAFLQPGPEGKDAMIHQWKNAWNYGSANSLVVRDWGSDSDYHSLLQFNLGSIPHGATIHSAELALYQNTTSTAGGSVDAYRITSDWVEGSGNGGAAPGVTWNNRDTGVAWATPGGDFAGEAYASTAIPVGTSGWFTWDISGLVSGWVSGSFPNQGLALVHGSSNAHAQFVSSDATDPTLHPKLSITYACECGSACLAPQGTGNLLMVVVNPTTLVPEDQKAKDLFESWGYTVKPISESANQSAFDAEFGVQDVVFVSETVNSSQLGNKLKSAPIGVVTQDGDYNGDLGFASNSAYTVGTDVDITDNDHFITRVFAPGNLQIYDASMQQLTVAGTVTVDAQTLAESSAVASLVTLEKGAAIASGTAAGRRVMLPLGTRYNFNWDYLNANGRLMVQRALAWGIGADATSIGNLLFVSGGFTVAQFPSGDMMLIPTAQEQLRIDLIESWGYAVNLIDDDASQTDFDTAIAANDVAYIPQDITSSSLGSKLTAATIGIVNEEKMLLVELGFSGDFDSNSRSEIVILDNTHSITSGLALGTTTITTSNQPLTFINNGSASGAQILAETNQVGSFFEPSLLTLETNAALFGGGFAAGKRVALPWGDSGFDINALTDDGRIIMRRALEWGAGASIPIVPKQLLLVVPDAITLGVQDSAKKALIESWGYTVTLIDDNATQAEFDAAVVAADVAYVSVMVSDAAVGNKLVGASIGVLNEKPQLVDEFGYSTDMGGANLTEIDIGNNSHYITSPFSIGLLTIHTSPQPTYVLRGTYATGLETLAAANVSGWSPTLAVLEVGENLSGGGTAAGRRVKLPWGVPAFDHSLMNADGETIMRRAIEWGAGAGDSATGPIAHWKLDDGAGTTAIDSEGGHDGTLMNGPTWVAGQLGDALNFDGSNDYVDLTSDAELDDVFIGGATVMAWIEPAGWGGNGYGRIFDKSSSASSTGDGWVVRLNTDNQGLNFGQGFSSGRGWWRIPSNSISLGSWHHIALSYDASSTANDPVIYVNGSPVAVTRVDTPSGSVRSDAALNLRLGMHASSVANGFDGKIDDARIYDRMLSAAEIADIGGGGGGGGSGPANILLVVGSASFWTTGDNDRYNQMIDWGYDVTVFDDGESQAAFNTAIGVHDVVFVTNSVIGGTLADKLTGAAIGIVNEFPGKLDNFGFSSSTARTYTSSGFSSTNPGHFITEPFSGLPVTTFTTYLPMPAPDGVIAPGLINLGTPNGAPMDMDVPPSGMSALDTGAIRWDGRPAPARRVLLPFGPATLSQLTPDALIIMHRAIEWTGTGAGGGGGACAATFSDDFETGDYTGSIGTATWAGDWTEINDSGNPGNGDVVIAAASGNQVLQIGNSTKGAQRVADLSAYTSATLELGYWLSGLDSVDEFGSVEVSTDGSNWTLLEYFVGPGNDSTSSPPTVVSYDISAHLSATTHIRFMTAAANAKFDRVLYDDVEICASN